MCGDAVEWTGRFVSSRRHLSFVSRRHLGGGSGPTEGPAFSTTDAHMKSDTKLINMILNWHGSVCLRSTNATLCTHSVKSFAPIPSPGQTRPFQKRPWDCGRRVDPLTLSNPLLQFPRPPGGSPPLAGLYTDLQIISVCR